jgi:hypothetical protein
MGELLPPGPVIKPDQHKKTYYKENIEENIAYSNPSFDIEKFEIDASCHIDHHPGDAIKNRPGNFFEKISCFWLYAAHSWIVYS